MAEHESGEPVNLDFARGVRPMATSDEDRTLLPELSESMWQRYEDAVRRIITERVPSYVRIEGTHLPGELSGIDRQIDVLLRAPLMDDVTSVIVVECKRYARRVGIGTVDELYGKLIDVGAEHGVLCAPNGFTDAARARAENSRNPRIVLYDLNGHEELDLDDFPGPDCRAYGCDWGFVSWGTGKSASGETIGMGSCDRCGSIAVRCEACGYELAADGVDECECGYRFKTAHWHDGSEWVVRVYETDDDEVPFDWAWCAEPADAAAGEHQPPL